MPQGLEAAGGLVFGKGYRATGPVMFEQDKFHN